MAAQVAPKAISHDGYTVGWICALPKEQTAATAMLDHIHDDLQKPPNDPNTYTLGSIGKHNIVIACLPKGKIGNNSSATFATQMVRTFPSIKVGLMVGIGGGIPPKVRLGDVVVSTPVDRYPGVVQWDFGKTEDGGKFKQTGALNNPPNSLLTALAKLETNHEMSGSKIPQYLEELEQKWPKLVPKYTRLESLEDPLASRKTSYRSDGSWQAVCSVFWHIILVLLQFLSGQWASASTGLGVETVAEGTESATAHGGQRQPGGTRVHYGLIASGNQVIKDAEFRDMVNERLGGNVLCFEMEAAGLMEFPSIVIRGICDYANSQKNKDWQEYAATVAAAFAKELLQYVQPSHVDVERPLSDILSQVRNDVSTIQENTTHTRVKLDRKEHIDILDWLTPIDYGPQQSDYLSRWQQETGNWLLESEQFLSWRAGSKQTLFCPGIPGAGKTILTSVVVNSLESKFRNDPEVGIAYIYCNFRRQHEQKIDDLLASVLKQLTQCRSSLPRSIRDMYDQHKKKRTRPSLVEIVGLLHSVAAMYSRVFIIVDALDECQISDGCRMKFLLEISNLQIRHGTNNFATSRPIPEILNYFKTSLSIEIRARPNDVERYIESQIGLLPSLVQLDQQLRDEITKSISEVVDGMFLLAQLYLGLLTDKLTPNDIQATIETFRKQAQGSGKDEKDQTLDHAYEQTMERISGQLPGMKTLALKVLSWVTCARRQLTTSELQHALATKNGKCELDLRDLTQVRDMVSVCAGLVTVDEESGVIRLVHYTTQEYLKQTQERWFRGAESAIAITCVTYLSFAVFETGFCGTDQEFEDRLRLNPFYDYAAHNWGHHAPRDDLLSEVITFLKSGAKVEASSQALMVSKKKKRTRYSRKLLTGTTGLHLAGYFGASKAADILLRLKHNPDQKDTYGRTPLWYACQNGCDAVVKLLIEAGANVDVGIDRAEHLTLLQVAAKGGYCGIIEKLLIAGADVNAEADRYGQTALQAAAKGGHLEVVEKLLAAGANVNAEPAKYGQTAIQAAAKGGHLEIVEKLLAAGADANAEAVKYGYTALQAAAKGGHLDVIKKLLAVGADVNAQPADNSRQTALQAAAEGGHLEVVEKLLAVGADVNAQAAIDDGRTALQAAAKEGHLEIIKRLLAAGANVNAEAAKYRQTAIQAAAQGGHLEVIEKLLAAGADLNAEAADKHRRTALQAAAEGGHLEVVEKLLAVGADVNAQAAIINGQTALQAAADGGHLEVVKKLLAVGANVNAEAAEYGLTALQAAAQGGYLEVVEKLLAVGADVNAQATIEYGQTALQAAADGGHLEVVEKLLAVGADVNAEAAEYGQTALQAAAIRGHLGVVKTLLAVGANVNAKAGEYRRTAIQAAADGGHLEVVEKLLAAGANVNAEAAEYGQTALQAAAQGGHLEVVEKLLAAGADVNAQAAIDGGQTALQAAAKGGHLEVVEKLLAVGADVNAQAAIINGQTALQAAAEGGHLEVVEKLLAVGADVNAKAAEYGQTALQAAAKGGHLEVVEKLLAVGADVNAEAAEYEGTALQAAAGRGYLHVVEKLIAAGADMKAIGNYNPSLQYLTVGPG